MTRDTKILTGWYLFLTAALVIAFLASCASVKPPPAACHTPQPVPTLAQNRRALFEECRRNAESAMSAEQADQFCTCMAKKTANAFPSTWLNDGADATPEESEQVNAFVVECYSEMESI